ncbi:MAG: hypothetical protein WCQ53_02340 [bacterium]
MKCSTLGALLCSACVATLMSCGDSTPAPVDQTTPAAATVVLSRLIFTGEANVGGAVKVEIKDSYIESALDGNPGFLGTTLTTLTALPEHKSSIKVTIDNLSYYDQAPTQIVCNEDSNNKMSIVYSGPFGSYYEGTAGKLYRATAPLQYIEQGLTENITEAAVSAFFLTSCKDTNGNSYEVSFYPSSDPLSHSITTTFRVLDGSLKGIIRVHHEGEGHVPFVDMLL